MGITPYQINNVLRVYGEQLRRGRISKRKSPTDTNSSDRFSISEKTRRESIFNDIISNIVERITRLKPHENVQSEHGKPLPDNDGRQMKLVFKEIGENG